MSYQVFALKYRPKTFDEVVGQEHVTQTLKNAIAKNRVANAFLFAGPRGVGKTSMARILAKSLNCTRGPTAEPCNTCNSCVGIAGGSFLDVLEIDGASHALVDDIRDIVDNVKYLPSQGRFKVYIIDEVHMLSQSAFNALLKTLEEPPSHVRFIFATTEPHKIPLTVVSRCQRFDFRRLPLRLVVERLKAISSGEGIDVSEDALFLIAREALGSMRDAQVLLDQALSFAGKKITAANLIDILGVPDRQVLYDLSSAIIARDPGRCLDLLEGIFSSGHDLKKLGEDLLEHFRNLLVLKIAGKADRLIDLPQVEIDALASQAKDVSPEDLYLFFRSLSDYLESLPKSSSPRIHMEMALARLSSLPAVTSIGGLIQRLEALEGRLSGAGPSDNSEMRAQGEVKGPKYSPPDDRGTPEKPSGKTPHPAGEPLSSSETKNSLRPSGPGGKSWDEFLKYMKEKKPRIASYLEKGVPLETQGNTIRIGFPPKSLFREHLQDKEESTALKTLAQEFYSQAPKFEYVEVAEAQNAQNPQSAAGKEKTNNQNVIESPIIRDALRIFGGGEIVEVKKP